jgi:5,10-methylenetetrahydromethanopterin reductase
MPEMKFGSPRYARDLGEFVEWCQLAEQVGLDLIGYGDSSALWIDPFVALTLAAQHTKRARLVTTVTNPATRHPSVMASGFAGLQAASNGRAVMGIGGGDSALLNLGMRPPPNAEMEEYIRCVRALCAGEEAAYHGRKLRMQWPQQHKLPIWIAANGPKTLELAGRVADGVIAHLGVDEPSVRETYRHIEAGARSAGRDPESIEVWWMTYAYISKTEEEGWRDLRFIVGGMANHVFRFGFEGKAVPEEMQAPLLQLQREYRSDLHADPRHRGGHNAELVERLGLTEFVGRRFALCGPPEQVAEGFRKMASWGATNHLLIQVVDDRIGALRDFDKQVLKLLR